jgi:hypothetical protein
MGRTVYGVDLEESPLGGLIRKLLTEEELDMIADGGTAAGRGAAPDGGSDADDENSDVDGTVEDAGAETDGGGTASDDGNDADADDWSVSDETDGSSGEVDGDSDDESATGAELSDSLGSPSSPPPSTAPGDRAGGYGAAGSTGSGGSSDFDSGGFGTDDHDYEDEDEDAGGVGGFLAAHKWLLLKVAVGLAAFAAVAVVVWRYRNKLTGIVPGRDGDDADDEFDVDAGGESTSTGVSPARRRAKVDADAGETPPPDGRDDADSREDSDREGDERSASDERPGERRPRDRAADDRSPGEDVDLGALVGLGTLAVIAALVRKFDEERTRPHDPLVDGPLDEDDADDDR